MESEDIKTLYTDAYREIEAVSKVLRRSIKHMPKYYRYNVGDRIISLLVDIKLEVKLTLVGLGHPANTIKLHDSLMTLGILVDNFYYSPFNTIYTMKQQIPASPYNAAPARGNSQLMARCLFCKATNTVKYTNYGKYYADK